MGMSRLLQIVFVLASDSYRNICLQPRLHMSLRDKEQVVKVICHKGSTAAAHGRFTSIVFARYANVHPHVTHASYAPRVHTPNGVSIGSAVFPGLTPDRPCCYYVHNNRPYLRSTVMGPKIMQHHECRDIVKSISRDDVFLFILFVPCDA